MVTPGPFFASAVLATNAVECMADPEHRAGLLPSLASGDTIATLAVFEPGRAWSVDSPATTATAGGSGYTLSGTKRTVMDAHLADIILVTASVDGGTGLFAVDQTSG